MLDDNVQDLENIEISIEEAKKAIEFREALTRLENNPDFKKVILDDYLRDNILRMVRLKAEPHFQDPKQQAYLENRLTAVSYFNQHLRVIHTQANQAEMSLAQDMEERSLLLREGEVE